MTNRQSILNVATMLCMTFASGDNAFARDWFVEVGGSGDGSSAGPFGSIQTALNQAQAGDIIRVAAGTYNESLTSKLSGVTLLAADGAGTTIVQSSNRVLDISHADFVLDGLVLDGAYGATDLLKIRTGADRFVMRNSEVRRSGRDCVDVVAVSNMLVEDSLIHHCLWWNAGRQDAHGIVGGPISGLTVRNTQIHTFSGDAIQLDPGRDTGAGWNDLVIEGCLFWLQPFANTTQGFPAGKVPGENALDTKIDSKHARARVTITDTVAHGFRNGHIANMAAFNLKEKIDAKVDRVTVYDAEIAFRLRGGNASGTVVGSIVQISNAVVFDVDKAVRYEDKAPQITLWNNTFGNAITRMFQAAGVSAELLDIRNNLFLMATKPSIASDGSNLAVDSSVFLNAGGNDYHLLDAAASPVDSGATIIGVVSDRDRLLRPQGGSYDVGAYEWCGTTCSTLDGSGPPDWDGGDPGQQDGQQTDAGGDPTGDPVNGKGDGTGISQDADSPTTADDPQADVTGGCACRYLGTETVFLDCMMALFFFVVLRKRNHRVAG